MFKVWNRRRLFSLYTYWIYLEILWFMQSGIKTELSKTKNKINIHKYQHCTCLPFKSRYCIRNLCLVQIYSNIRYRFHEINVQTTAPDWYNRVQAEAWRMTKWNIFHRQSERSPLRMQSIKCVIMMLNVLHGWKIFVHSLAIFQQADLASIRMLNIKYSCCNYLTESIQIIS